VITVSTDGSCLRNPGGAIGWAWINHDGTFDSGGAASGTNQVAELTALLQAVRAHPGAEPLLIESDSQYAIKCASEWVVAWKRKGWRTAGGQPVKNLELVRAIDRAITERPGPVRFRWVRGHVGDPFNERADQLAGLAAQEWAAGRGDVEGTLVPELGHRAGAEDRAAVATAAPGAARAGADPAWDMDTLFD
jgi:ribonuclease HI